MKTDWMFSPLPLERKDFQDHRRELGRLVHSGEFQDPQSYLEPVREAYARLEEGRATDLCENYCWITYTLASHCIVFGAYVYAEQLCQNLLAFLDTVRDHQTEFAKSSLLDHSGKPSWQWRMFRFKALRLNAIAVHHLNLRKSPEHWLRATNRCVEFVESLAMVPYHDRAIGDTRRAERSEHYIKFYVECLSDIARGFFRFYVYNKFEPVTVVPQNTLREYFVKFRNASQALQERRIRQDLPDRLVDTEYKVSLMCYGDADLIRREADNLSRNIADRLTDKFAARETYFVAMFVANNCIYNREIVQELEDVSAEARNKGLVNAHNNLEHVRQAIGRT